MRQSRISPLCRIEILSSMKRSGLAIHRLDNLEEVRVVDGVLGVNITLCPLYIGKTLEESDLLPSGTNLAGMRQSRVYPKLTDGFACVQCIKDSVDASSTDIEVHFTFADTGVLLNHEPKAKDDKNLLHHLWLYRKAIRKAAAMKDVRWDLNSFSNLNDTVLPKFLSQKPAGSRALARRLFSELTLSVLSLEFFDSSMVNRRDKSIKKNGAAIIAAMVDAFGYATTRALIIQYGFYDALTSEPHELNLYFERGPLLLNLTNLFPHKHYPRVDILCH